MRVILLIVSLIASACSSHAPLAEPVPVPKGVGIVGLEVISDPSLPRLKLGTEQDFVHPAAAPDSPLPAYPSDLLPLELPPVAVTLRIIIDENGAVVETGQSPAVPSTDTPWLERFLDSACETVPRWRFQPATVRTFAPGADLDGDGTADYKVLESERRVRMLLDLRFTFEIADGKGLVRSDGATRAMP